MPPDRQRGSVLMLFPAGVLVLMVLAAITVDFSIAFLGERELAHATASAANDAAIEGLSNAAFYREGKVRLSAETDRIATARVLDLVDRTRYHGLDVHVTVTDCLVVVTAEADVDYVFAKAIPGGPDRAHVDATSEARPRQAAGGPACP